MQIFVLFIQVVKLFYSSVVKGKPSNSFHVLIIFFHVSIHFRICFPCSKKTQPTSLNIKKKKKFFFFKSSSGNNVGTNVPIEVLEALVSFSRMMAHAEKENMLFWRYGVILEILRYNGHKSNIQERSHRLST